MIGSRAFGGLIVIFVTFLSLASTTISQPPDAEQMCAFYATSRHFSPPLTGFKPPTVWNTSTFANGSCEFLYKTGDPVCCNSYQATALSENFVILSQVFTACPACLVNIKTMWCGYTCSPYQASFVTVIQNGTGFNAGTTKVANFTMTPEYGKGLYDTCNKTDLGTAFVFISK